MIARRRLFQLGLSALGAAAVGPSAHAQDDIIGALLEAQAPPAVAPVVAIQPVIETAPKWVSLYNLHTAEKLQAVYWEKGTYVPDALDALNKVLRDHRTGEVAPMNVQLFDMLADIHRETETKTAFQIISGYRSAASNKLLSERSGEVAKRSLHMDGKAMDIYLEDVALDKLRAAALDLKRGGVGYYPDSKFVHVDVGPFRRWQGS
ncbi:DUF882 domain-containing protein [Caulobacter sp. DWR1-3-2b1]|uniref:DUF882 domain-containing protein n=1 Tax=Caulobacter sp. DWR1-3-2b1 TaxID=2804670 RepID=UPI003CEA2B88